MIVLKRMWICKDQKEKIRTIFIFIRFDIFNVIMMGTKEVHTIKASWFVYVVLNLDT